MSSAQPLSFLGMGLGQLMTHHILQNCKWLQISPYKASAPTLPVLSPGRPEKWMYSADPFSVSPKNCLLKTIFWVNLLYWLNELWFPSVTDEQPLQNHLLSKTIIPTQWALSPRRPNNEHAELLPHGHWWAAFSWPFLSTTLLTHRALSPRRPKYTCRSFLGVTDKWHVLGNLLSKTVLIMS